MSLEKWFNQKKKKQKQSLKLVQIVAEVKDELHEKLRDLKLLWTAYFENLIAVERNPVDADHK